MNKTCKNLEYMGKQDRHDMIRSEFDPTFAAIRTAVQKVLDTLWYNGIAGPTGDESSTQR